MAKTQEGRLTGCTISVILFSNRNTPTDKSWRKREKGRKTENIKQPTWMISPLHYTHIQARQILISLDEAEEWVKMNFKPRKLRDLIVKKGKKQNHSD
jgi:hypothetical protein